MRSLPLLLAAIAAALLPYHAAAFVSGHRDIHHDHWGQDLRRRNIVYNGNIADAYDFVIVGGGTAGLAIASRLSEDANTTVLVLEAGDTGDAVADSINVPVNAYYAGLPGTSYDWQYTTVKQPNANNRALPWPRGKLLGGSSAMNGLYTVRPSKIEVDAWAALNDGASDKWNWDALFNAMKQSETFTPPSSQVQQTGNIQYDAASRGTSGPVHATYPGFMVPIVGNWTSTLADIGVFVNNDAYNGEGWGAFVATSSINPANWTRSYSRSAYIDPLPPRPNLAVLPNATVTRLLFDSSNKNNLTATGVEWAVSANAARQTVKVNKEVILAGGAVGSPTVLMLSGVGPSDVLQAAGVDVLVDLPGVGQHLQDHISTQVVWTTHAQTANSLRTQELAANSNANTAAFLSFVNSATAYVNITDLLGDAAQQFQQQVVSALSSSVAGLVPSTSDEVKKGYEAIYNTTVNSILTSPVGQVEILFSLTGQPVDGSATVAIQAALQHPYSHGRVYITTSDPFTLPAIDPQYLAHNADLVLLREGLKLARKIGNSPPLSAALGDEVSPGSSVQSDSDWEDWLAGQIGTEYHPSCSCAMLPRELGGVVDPDLKVYGLGNVRVADASVFPIQFSAHLQAPVYGLAEQAAKIIRATYNGVGWPSANGTSSASASNSSSTSSSAPSPTSEPQKETNGALGVVAPSIAVACVGVLASLLL
ncbi:GMC oxidoreductase [Trametes cinnabarina]|uniref:GMC oxidoreductase n=1 Tax=Pycnoporus cinnabarinus TaxID=5643 RepID=A0A060SAY5_PYCCI|nr:GMC oxidoreductase [Trametes cinnabarina]